MAVIVLASAGHAPGVTTTALGLTLAWPRDVLLADCDRLPSQSVLAGYLQGVDAGHSGLGRLLQVHRERRPMEAELESETLALTNSPLGSDSIARNFLPGFPHPGVVSLFGTAWPDLMAAFGSLAEDVIIDAGRIGAEGLPRPLLQGADAILVITRTSLLSLAALRLYLPLVVEQAAARTGLLLVGEGMPYGRKEIEAQFGAGVWVGVDHDPHSAAVLSDGTLPSRRFADARLPRSLRSAAGTIADRVAAARKSDRGAPMNRLTEVPLLRGMPFETVVAADRLPDLPRRARPANPASPAAATVDWNLIVVLRRKASELIARTLVDQSETGTAMADVDRRLLGRSVVRRVVRDHAEQLSSDGQALWPIALEHAYAESVENAIFGYGRLQPLFEIPDAENIEIHGCDSVMVQFGDGSREPRPPVADSDEELVEAIRFLGESVSPARPFDDAHPTMTLALGDRFRLHAIGFGLSYRPSITIRQHTLTEVSLADLVSGGTLPENVGRLLHAAVLARKSMVISGDQGAGKTTLLRALIEAIPANERFGTLETDYELLTHLQPGRRNMLALQAKVGMGEQQDGRRLGEFTITDLIPEALRQNLSRLVVGEVRGGEAAAMFEAMQAGAGTLSTTHSHSAASTIDRLASRVAQGGVLTIAEAYRQIAHHIDLLIYLRLEDDTWRGGRRNRLVAEVRQLTGGLEDGRPVTHLVYAAPTATGPEHFHPDPEFADGLAQFTGAWDEDR